MNFETNCRYSKGSAWTLANCFKKLCLIIALAMDFFKSLDLFWVGAATVCIVTWICAPRIAILRPQTNIFILFQLSLSLVNSLWYSLHKSLGSTHTNYWYYKEVQHCNKLVISGRCERKLFFRNTYDTCTMNSYRKISSDDEFKYKMHQETYIYMLEVL